MPTGVDVLAAVAVLIYQALVAVGVLSLTFHKSMSYSPVRMKTFSFSRECQYPFFTFFSYNISNEACLIS